MKESSKRAIFVVLIALAIFFGWKALYPPVPSDADQIKTQISSMAAAAESRNVNNIMSGISEKYSDDNGLNSDSLRFNIAHALHASNEVRVQLGIPDLKLDGDTAKSSQEMQLIFKGSGGETSTIHANLVLDWRRENGTRFFVIPIKTWRVAHASYGSIIPGN
jgi:hypothetical protein